MKIVHITTVHARGDTRIRVKETASLAGAFDVSVSLYVQDGGGDERSPDDGVEIVDTGTRSEGRLARMTVGALRMYCAVRRARPTVVHFHDPELIPVGLALKLHGIKVIYDVHEDLPRQILGKHWLRPWLRRAVSWVAEGIERVGGWVFDGVVAATPTIARRFPAKKTVTVQNFPILSELVVPNSVSYEDRFSHFVYVGGIAGVRGSREMVEAIDRVEAETARLQLAGAFSTDADERLVRSLPGWARVEFHGWLNRLRVAQLLGKGRAGLVVLHPTSNYPDAYPVKMFEYMAAGLPVIASDFPLWRDIVHGADCGLVVDPLNPDAIARAMDRLLKDPEEAKAMGQRGRYAVETTYNWEMEADKLIDLYQWILSLIEDERNKVQ